MRGTTSSSASRLVTSRPGHVRSMNSARARPEPSASPSGEVCAQTTTVRAPSIRRAIASNCAACSAGMDPPSMRTPYSPSNFSPSGSSETG